MYYQYDGSFPGFLSAIYEAYQDGTSQVEGIENTYTGTSLFNNGKVIDADLNKAEKVIGALCKNCGAEISRTVYYAFMSDQPEREMLLFYYLRCAFRYKKNLPSYRRDPWINQIENWALKTSNERHRLLGLLRFSELTDGILYASVRPDYNVVPLMAGHFAARLSCEEWAIHDLKRHIAVYYDKKRIITADVTETEKDIKYSNTEEEIRSIWRKYYHHIAIEERKNPNLRRSFMPEKYWSCLTEMTAPENN